MLRSETKRLPFQSRIPKEPAPSSQTPADGTGGVTGTAAAYGSEANGAGENEAPAKAALTTELNARSQRVGLDAKGLRDQSNANRSGATTRSGTAMTNRTSGSGATFSAKSAAPKAEGGAKPNAASSSTSHEIFRTPNILAYIMRCLPLPSLAQSAQVNQLWRSAAQGETKLRESALHSELIVLQLKGNDDDDHRPDTDFSTELDANLMQILQGYYKEPRQVIAFLSVETVANGFEMVENSTPAESESLVLRSDDGVVGTDVRGRCDLHYGKGVEALSFIALPKWPDVRIVPFAAPSLGEMKLADFFLENAGIRSPEEKGSLRAALVFAELDDPADVRHKLYPKSDQARNLRGDYTGGHGGNVAVVGVTVASARHQNKRLELERKASVYDSSQRIARLFTMEGLLIAGIGVHVKSVVLDRQFLYDAKLVKEFRDLKSFFGDSAANRFAFIFTGIAGDYDGKIRKTFAEEFPRIPLLGCRSKGAVFGNPTDSTNPAPPRSLMGADMLLGDMVAVVAVRVDPDARRKLDKEKKRARKQLFTPKKPGDQDDKGPRYYRKL